MADDREAMPIEESLEAAPRFALVSIDTKLATILRWRGRVVSERVVSEVPPRVRSTAHLRYNPRDRHGGSGRGQDRERQRNEHIRSFLRAVAGRLGQDGRIEILGTGTIGSRLAAMLRTQTYRRRWPQRVEAFHASPLTPRQLAARLRERLGLTVRRLTVGAFRWSGALPRTRSGAVRGPRRVVEKVPKPATTDLDWE